MSNEPVVAACREQDAVHVRVDGRAVAHDCPALRRYVEAAVSGGCLKVFVHLQQCDHFDSTFLGTLLCLQRTSSDAGSVDLCLVNASDAAEGVLKRMGATSLFRLVSDRSVPEDLSWTVFQPEQPGNCSHEFKQNVVQAHQRLAEVDGPLATTYRQIAEMAAQDLEAAQRR